MVVKLFRFMLSYFKINLQSAMEYRANFILQTFFMFLNDIVWVVFWWIFFNKFNVINNWAFNDMLMLYAIVTIAWGLSGMFFGNFLEIADIVKQGKFDFYLTLPKEELTHLLISNTRFQAFGDFLFGLVIVGFFIPITKYPLLIILITLSTVILLSFAVILGSLSFYIGSASEIAGQGMMGILSIASYPLSIFEGFTKFIVLILIPAGFITGVPVELLKTFDIKWFLYLLTFTALLSYIALIIFKIGVKKYESGNLINVRV